MRGGLAGRYGIRRDQHDRRASRRIGAGHVRNGGPSPWSLEVSCEQFFRGVAVPGKRTRGAQLRQRVGSFAGGTRRRTAIGKLRQGMSEVAAARSVLPGRQRHSEINRCHNGTMQPMRREETVLLM